LEPPAQPSSFVSESIARPAVRPAGPPPGLPTTAAPPGGGARAYHLALGVAWLAIAVPLTAWGLDYYLTPLGLRPDHPHDALFRPTGLVGNRLGIVGTLMIGGGVAMYVVRKRWTRLHGLGKLRHWLSFHIWLCTLGPFLILLHTSLKVGGLVSIAFWSMVVVVASGVVGRYVYVRIPKTLSGSFLELREIESGQRALREALAASGVPEPALDALAVSLPPRAGEASDDAPGLVRAFALAVRAEWAGRAALRRLRHADGVQDVRMAARLAQQYRRLSLGRLVLVPFGRVFRYWHAVHLPLAVVMALILLVHVGVAVALGYAWTPSP